MRSLNIRRRYQVGVARNQPCYNTRKIWFSALACQDHLTHKTSPSIIGDHAKTADGIRCNFLVEPYQSLFCFALSMRIPAIVLQHRWVAARGCGDGIVVGGVTVAARRWGGDVGGGGA
nr:hypothetical protein [Tanacetum cinerariifolium]